jgi:hypothetical protein
VLKAAQDAISSSLLEVSIDSATGVLFNVTGPMDLGLAEVRGYEAGTLLLLPFLCGELACVWQTCSVFSSHVLSVSSTLFGALLLL